MGWVSFFEIKNGAKKWVVENQPEKRKPRSLSENRRRLKVSPWHNGLLYFQPDKVSLDAK